MKTRDRSRHVVMLLAYYPPRFGGSGAQAQRLARELSAKGVRVTVLTTCPPGGGLPDVEEDGRMTVRRFRAGRRRSRFEKICFALSAAAWLARRSDWEILHLHGFGSWAVLPVYAARLRGRPVVVKTTLTVGYDPARLVRRSSRLRGALARAQLGTYRRCDAVVALSAEIEDALQRDGGFGDRVVRIPNGVDVELFRPPTNAERSAIRGRLDLREDAFVVLTAAALVARKNLVGLVEAVAQLGKPNVSLLLAGPEGPEPGYRAKLQSAIESLPPSVEARWLGERSPTELADLYRAADVFVLNSYGEGLSNALLEAMSSGLPVIATDVSGSRDVLSRKEGRLVPPGDTHRLAETIADLASDPHLRSRLGAAGRELIVAHYGLPHVAERYRALYGALLAGYGLRARERST